MNRHGQLKQHGEAERMPRMATAELAGARRNQATKSLVTQSPERGERLGLGRVSERERGGRLGRAGPV
jgi:hypothetical protein